MKIIVGLGNPGEKYKKTRHNIGFMVLDRIAKRESLEWKLDKKHNALVTKFGDITLAKPQTFMNNSGVAVRSIMSYYNLIPKTLKIFRKKDCNLADALTVIHDDVDIDFGKIKTTDNSRAAGNNGVQSIINHLKTKNYSRVRVGIRNEKLKKVIPVKNFVLMRFDKIEEEILDDVIEQAIAKLQ